MQYIRAETIEGNEIIFWGSLDSCVNLLALENQEMPVLITCQECNKENTCTHLLGEYFSVHESSVVTIYPPDAEDLADKEHTLSQLSKAMNKCVACHAAYRLM